MSKTKTVRQGVLETATRSVIETLESRMMLSAGLPDYSFYPINGGYANVDMSDLYGSTGYYNPDANSGQPKPVSALTKGGSYDNGRTNIVHDIIYEPSGKYVIIGESLGRHVTNTQDGKALIQTTDTDIFVARYNADGTLDTENTPDQANDVVGSRDYHTRFGGTTAAPSNNPEIYNDVPVGGAIDPITGDIVVVGYTNFNGLGGDQAIMMRYSRTAFGNGGVTSARLSAFDGATITGMTMQSDGKFLVYGSIYFISGTNGGQPTGGTAKDMLVMRYNADGSPDLTFQHDTHISNGGDARVIRYNTYSSDEIRDVVVEPATLANGQLNPNAGKIILLGYTDETDSVSGGYSKVVVRRLLADGRDDTVANGSTAPFGNQGVLIMDNFGGQSALGRKLAIQSDGKILLMGVVDSLPYLSGYDSTFVARLNADGTLDRTFINTGIAYITDPAGTSPLMGQGLDVQSDGKIIVSMMKVDTTTRTGALEVSRLSNTGRYDLTYGAAGFAQLTTSNLDISDFVDSGFSSDNNISNYFALSDASSIAVVPLTLPNGSRNPDADKLIYAVNEIPLDPSSTTTATGVASGSYTYLIDTNAQWISRNQWYGYTVDVTLPTGETYVFYAYSATKVDSAGNTDPTLPYYDKLQLYPRSGGAPINIPIGSTYYFRDPLSPTQYSQYDSSKVTGTAGATSSTVVDGGAKWSDGQWNGYWLDVTSGVYVGRTFLITGTSKTGTGSDFNTLTISGNVDLTGLSYQIRAAAPRPQSYAGMLSNDLNYAPYFQMGRVQTDPRTPNAVVQAFDVYDQTTTYQFLVTYSDDVLVNYNTLNTSNVQVVDPSNNNKVFGTITKADIYAISGTYDGNGDGLPDARTITVQYTLTVAGGFPTDKAHAYTIRLLSNQVSDADTHTGTATGGTITTLVDTSMHWTSSTEFVGKTVKITDTNGKVVDAVVTGMGKSNASLSWYDTLVFSNATAFVAAGASYVIQTPLYAAGSDLGAFTVRIAELDQTPPTASFDYNYDSSTGTFSNDIANGLTVGGRARFYFHVRYSDIGSGINTAALLASADYNLAVTNGQNYFQYARFEGINDPSNGTGGADDADRTVWYSIPAPSGFWNSGDNGVYQIWVQKSQIADNATPRNDLAYGMIGQFNVSIVVDARPTAELSPVATVTQAQSAITFDVTYKAYDGSNGGNALQLIENSIKANNGLVKVTGPNGFSGFATFVSITPDQSSAGSFVVKYSIAPASAGGWTMALSGTYSVAVLGNQVYDNDSPANYLQAATLGVINIAIKDNQAPTATMPTVTISNAGTTPATLVVTYRDNVAIDLSTITDGNLVLKNEAGTTVTTVTWKMTSIDFNSNGTPRVVTYTITPTGDWSALPNGNYSIFASTSPVKDTNGNPVSSSIAIGSFVVSIAPDVVPPDATLVSHPDIAAIGTAPYYFTVRYTDAVSVLGTSLGDGNITIIGADGTKYATTLTSAVPSGDSASILVTYSLAPIGGAWSGLQNGTYTIQLNGAQISDTSGNKTAQKTLGTFKIAIPVAAVIAKLGTVTTVNAGDNQLLFSVTYTCADNIIASTLTSSNVVQLVGNGLTLPATYVSGSIIPSAGNAKTFTVQYAVNAPNGGSWDYTKSGTYTVVVKTNNGVRSVQGGTLSGGNLSPTININVKSAALSGGTLYIAGTDNADMIEVLNDGKTVTVIVNNVTTTFATSLVTNGMIIRALGGNDTVKLHGTDPRASVYGGDGNDTIYGTDRGDSIDGGAGNDYIVGGAGNDTLYGGNGADTVYGGNGNDSIDGGNGADMLYGQVGNDTIHGSNGNDSISGGQGDDVLYGDAGNNTLNGGAGNDIIYARNGQRDVINGGGGYDKAQIDYGLDSYTGISQLLA